MGTGFLGFKLSELRGQAILEALGVCCGRSLKQALVKLGLRPLSIRLHTAHTQSFGLRSCLLTHCRMILLLQQAMLVQSFGCNKFANSTHFRTRIADTESRQLLV